LRLLAKDFVVVCICGLTGSGKSTIAKRLAKKYALKYYSGGDALRDLAIQEGYKPKKRGWWESKEGIRFLEKRGEDSKFDKSVDETLLKVAEQGSLVLDSWTMPWLLGKGFKIWLEASMGKRAKRVAERGGMSVEDASKALEKKEKKTKEIYRKLYDFNLGKDFSPFHLLIDTDYLNKEEVFQIVCMVLDNLVLKSCENQ
jgi:cytidylate kinase